MIFEVTDKAKIELKKSIAEKDSKYIRVGLRGTGCNGYEYSIEIEYNQPQETDFKFEYDQVTVLIDKKSAIYLNNSTLDYEINLMKKGFKFINSNVKSVCGCGKSIDFK